MQGISQPKSITSLPPLSVSASPLLNNSPSLHPFIISSFRSTGSFFFPSLAHSPPLSFHFFTSHMSCSTFLHLCLTIPHPSNIPLLFHSLLMFFFILHYCIPFSLSLPLPNLLSPQPIHYLIKSLTILRRSVWTKSLCSD